MNCSICLKFGGEFITYLKEGINKCRNGTVRQNSILVFQQGA